jgi:PAS domain-containing protein
VSRYGLAALLAGLAVLASLELAPLWSPRYLLWPCYPAVMLSAWFGGVGPGLVTTLVSALMIAYVGTPPTHSLMIRDPGGLTGLVSFLSVGVLLSALNAQLLSAQRRAEALTRDFQRETDERKTVEAVAGKLATIADELQTEVERYREQIGRFAAVFRARRDGRIVECNDLFVSLLGASSIQQVRTLNVKDLFLEPAHWQELVASLTPRVVVSNEKLRWRRDDGTPLTVLATLREADGFIEGVAVAAAAPEPF